MNNHPYHLVDNSPWPIISSIGALTFTSGMIMLFHKHNNLLLMIGIMILLMTMIQWWRDASCEGTFIGLHTFIVVNGLSIGMILFIISEIFFISFFLSIFS